MGASAGTAPLRTVQPCDQLIAHYPFAGSKLGLLKAGAQGISMGFLSGFSIAVTIRSLDPSLFSQLILAPTNGLMEVYRDLYRVPYSVP